MIACNHLEDTNGANDFTILPLTDMDITKTSVSHIVLCLGKMNNKIFVKKLLGVYTLSTNDVENERLIYNLSSTFTKGNYRIVIVEEGMILKDILNNSEETLVIKNSYGKNKLRLAVKSAKFSVNYTIETN